MQTRLTEKEIDQIASDTTMSVKERVRVLRSLQGFLVSENRRYLVDLFVGSFGKEEGEFFVDLILDGMKYRKENA